MIFIEEREILIQTEEPIESCQRPLRAQTAQGDKNSLASSEEIAAGAVMEFSIIVMSDGLVPAVKEWLASCGGLGSGATAGRVDLSARFWRKDWQSLQTFWNKCGGMAMNC